MRMEDVGLGLQQVRNGETALPMLVCRMGHPEEAGAEPLQALDGPTIALVLGHFA